MRFLIIDDHPVLRTSLKRVLLRNFPPCTVEEAEDTESAGAMLDQKQWDVIVLDIDLPGRGGMDFLRDIAVRAPKARVIVFSGCNEAEYGLRAIKAGAAGFLHKTSAEPELLLAFQRVIDGKKHIGQDLMSSPGDAAGKHDNRPPRPSLSEREFEVLRLFAVGSPTKEIAGKLGLSMKTVSTYRARILQKLELKTTADIVRYAITNELG